MDSDKGSALFICGSISAVIAFYFMKKIDRVRDQISEALEDPEAVQWEN